MSTTVKQYLTRPNPTVNRHSAVGGLTFSQYWLAIEGVRPWKDFNYKTLSARYKTELGKTIPSIDLNNLIKRSRFDETLNEDSVTAFLLVNCMLPVNSALWEVDKELHFATGSMFAKVAGAGSPDWGCGDANPQLIFRKNICPGDIKCSSKWNGDGLLKANWSNYQQVTALANQAKPLEQVQHYEIYFGTRYGWILTDMELVVIRLTNSADDDSTSPRQTRASEVGTGREAHQRVVSNTSNLSSAVSAMSLDHSAYSGHTGSSSGSNPAPLEIVCIPMSAAGKGQLTVNFALFCLALLASEDCVISTSYPPLGPQTAPKQAASKSTSKSGLKVSSKKSQKPPRSQPSAASPATQFWIAARDIQWEVIKEDIAFHLPGASVKTASNDGNKGYQITAQATADDLKDAISYLKADTMSWGLEGNVAYPKSKTYSNRRDEDQEEDEESAYGSDENE